MLLLGILFFCFILVMSFVAIQSLGQDYLSLKNADMSVSKDYMLLLNDHIYAMTAYGINIDPSISDMAQTVKAFMEKAMRSIDAVILSCGILYTMITNTILSYFVYQKNKNHRQRHTISIALSVIGTYAIFIGFVVLCHFLFHLPFYSPDGHGVIVILVSILSVIGGECALGVLLRKIKWKKTVALATIPVVFLLFLSSFNFAYHLYCPSALESFDYVQEIEKEAFAEDYEGEVYYDDNKNAVIVDGREYAPQLIDNADAYHGLQRAGAYVFEIWNPYSGNSLYFLEISEEKIRLSVIVLLLYGMKACMWMMLCGLNTAKKKTTE